MTTKSEQNKEKVREEKKKMGGKRKWGKKEKALPLDLNLGPLAY